MNIPKKLKRLFCNHDYRQVKTTFIKGTVTTYYICAKCGKVISETWTL